MLPARLSVFVNDLDVGRTSRNVSDITYFTSLDNDITKKNLNDKTSSMTV